MSTKEYLSGRRRATRSHHWGPARRSICGSRPPTRSQTCSTTACAPMPPARASMSSWITATSPCQAGERAARSSMP